MEAAEPGLNLQDALRVKSAELWLEVGKPFDALLELQQVTKRGWQHPWASRVFNSAANQVLESGNLGPFECCEQKLVMPASRAA